MSLIRVVLAAVSVFGAWVVLDPVTAASPRHATSSSVAARFTRVDADRPVVWRTCDAIQVLVNPGPGGASAFAEIRAAFDEAASFSGLRFDLRRDDALVPQANWAVSGSVASYGSPPPVLVAWVDPSQTDLLREGVAGAAVANPLRLRTGRHLVTGAVALDASQYDDFLAGAGAGKTRRNLLLHEIGHLLGLDHVDDHAALMYTVVGPRSPDGFTAEEKALLREQRPSCP
jgi:hypothetical protein